MATLDKDNLSGITRIYVGTPPTPFDVHIGLLRSRSPFFDGLFKGHSIEEIQTNPVPLPNEDADLFGDLVSWIYRDTIYKYAVAEDNAFFLFRLWVMAAKFEMPLLQNYVMSHFLVVMNTQPGGVYDKIKIDFVYDNTPPCSPLRRLVADMWARNGAQSGFPELLQTMPRAFLEDVCAAFFVCNDKEPVPEISHGDFEERYYVQPPAPQEPPKRPFKEAEEDSVVPRRATPAQMSRRRIITPRSHLHTRPKGWFRTDLE